MYGIHLHLNHKHQPNVGKDTSPMDPMGVEHGGKSPKVFVGSVQVLYVLCSCWETSGQKGVAKTLESETALNLLAASTVVSWQV